MTAYLELNLISGSGDIRCESMLLSSNILLLRKSLTQFIRQFRYIRQK